MSCQRELLLARHPVQSDKRLIEALLAEGKRPRTVANLLSWRKEVVALCLRQQTGGSVLVADIVDSVAGSVWTHRRNIRTLLALPSGPSGADYEMDETPNGDALVIVGFEAAHRLPHARRQAGKRAKWAADKRRQRGATCSRSIEQSPDRCSTEHLPKMSTESVYAGSKNKKTHPQPTVVPSTAAPEPAAQQSGWCPEESADPLFAGLGGLDPRAWLEAVHAREQQQQGAPDRAAEPEQTDVLADAAWWRQTHAARMPEFDPRFLELAQLSRRALTASLAVVLRTSHATKQHAGRRTLRLARAMQDTGLITPNAARYARALGGSHARAARRPT